MTSVRRLRSRFYKKRGGPRGIGNCCSDYCAGCIVCESYKYLREHGRFPSFKEVNPICREAMRIEHEARLAAKSEPRVGALPKRDPK